jgi:putative component of membrane protein insertase Oxa1/YidC/SpoIIIJ protein YidD
MRRVALFSIRIYQRYISPYKGFSCAYRCATSRASCSTLGYRAIKRFGFLKGLAVLENRTYKCGVANRRLRRSVYGAGFYQRGVCDAGCDSPSDCDCGMFGCDVFNSRSDTNRKPSGPLLTAIGYAFAGAIIGVFSLFVFSSHLVGHPWRVANLIVTPIAVGCAMVAIGALRARRGDEVLSIDRFTCGYVFALNIALVRFFLAT